LAVPAQGSPCSVTQLLKAQLSVLFRSLHHRQKGKGSNEKGENTGEKKERNKTLPSILGSKTGMCHSGTQRISGFGHEIMISLAYQTHTIYLS
jgi:hypothetical protein